MGFDPQRFFIGVVDFFSILLPGVVATYLLTGSAGRRVLGDDYPDLEGAEAVAAFLIVSYLLGHFIFLLGALLLDDHLYEPLRRATPGSQSRLEPGKSAAPGLVRAMSRVFVGKATHEDEAQQTVIRIKTERLDAIGAAQAINAFQWSKARLLLESAAALAKVERFEADSKFFRSLAVLFAVLVPVLLVDGRVGAALLSVLLLTMALWRYIDQRLKAITLAYGYVITMEARGAGG